MPGAVTCEVQDGLATLTLRQPVRFNAMSRAMWLALREAAISLAASDALRCIVVQGEGGHFCAGGDIAEYPSFRFDTEQLRHFHEVEVWGALQALLNCDVPLVARIDGNCMGAGLEIASCCDIRIAASDAKFGAPIARLGFPMAPRELQLVMGQVGATVARRMLLEAAVMDAPELLQRGFLSRVVAPDALDDAVQQSIARILALAPQAARMNKRSIRALAEAGAGDAAKDAGLDALLQTAYHYADSNEHREGIAAFLAKRPPNFA